MPRVRRRGHQTRGFTLDDEAYVAHGIEFSKVSLTPSQFAECWWKIRDVAMEHAAPGTRPYGWWYIEAPGLPEKHEDDATALLRLRVPLTPRDRHHLEHEQPPGPCSDGLLHFSSNYLRQFRMRLDTRRAWHSEEGRAGMADVWAFRITEIDAVLDDREARLDPGPREQREPGNNNRFAKEALCQG